MSTRSRLGASVLVGFSSIAFIAGCSPGEAQTAGRIYAKPPAYVLATLDAGQGMPENDPRVARYSELLAEIRAKCKNPPQEISDITIDVLLTLQRQGVQIDVYELLQRINEAMPQHSAEGYYDFRQIAAAFKALAPGAGSAS
jgi:hypothetical protein